MSTPSSTLSFRTLHISDFHIRDGDSYERDKVFDSLVKTLRVADSQCDLIMATGDIAFQGGPSEYNLATAWFDKLLDATRLRKERLFVIPGNHDIDRSAGEWHVRTLENEEESVKYFGTKDLLPHAAKLANFTNWYNSYFSGIRAWDANTTVQHPISLRLRDTDVTILLVNSALFSFDDFDHNRLWIGRRCLDRAVEHLPHPRSTLTLTLMHHPLSWLHDQERANIAAAISRVSHAVFRGHLHETDAIAAYDGVNSVLHLAAGACYQTRKFPQCAALVDIDISRSTASISPLRYEDKPHEAWTLDPSVFPNSPTGKGTFLLDVPSRVVVPESHSDLHDASFATRSRLIPVPLFQLTRFVDPIKFAGRRKELDQVSTILDSHESFVLAGTPRAGKTSFGIKVLDDLEQRAQGNVLGVRINLQFSIEHSISNFLGRTVIALAGAIARKVFSASHSYLDGKRSALPVELQERGAFRSLYDLFQMVKSRTHITGNKKPEALEPHEFESFVHDLVQLVSSEGFGRSVLFFDEANHLPPDFSSELLTNINESLGALHISSIYAANPDDPEAYTKLQDSIAHVVYLDAFASEYEMIELLNKYYAEVSSPNDPLPVKQDALQMIWELSNHRPYNIQWIASKAFGNARASGATDVEVAHVSAAFDHLSKWQPRTFVAASHGRQPAF